MTSRHIVEHRSLLTTTLKLLSQHPSLHVECRVESAAIGDVQTDDKCNFVEIVCVYLVCLYRIPASEPSGSERLIFQQSYICRLLPTFAMNQSRSKQNYINNSISTQRKETCSRPARLKLLFLLAVHAEIHPTSG